MFTSTFSLFTDHQLDSTRPPTYFMAIHKSTAINTTQHESRWQRVHFVKCGMRATQDPLQRVTYEWGLGSTAMVAMEWWFCGYVQFFDGADVRMLNTLSATGAAGAG